MIDERLARVALSRIIEPGDYRFNSVVTDFGGRDLHRRLLEGHDLRGPAADLAARLPGVDPEAELERAERLGIRFVMPGDDEWPTQLEDLARVTALNERTGVPIGLWVKGPLRLDTLGESVAVVGSRAATTYGAEIAAEVSAELVEAGRPVISGAAFGIDQAAHRGALSAGGPTVAVLACGADRVYPRAHHQLLDHLGQVAAVVSETPLGGAPQRIRFLARNRLIAALTRGTVVVEAAARSGALNTATWADRLSRSVMGVPGPVTSGASAGVHHMIRRGATLVTRGAEVLEMVGSAGEHLAEEPRGPETARDRLPVRHQQVLDAVPVGGGAMPASIARVAGLGEAEVAIVLDQLLDNGLVERHEDGWRLAELART
jgi:DNA processing protein